MFQNGVFYLIFSTSHAARFAIFTLCIEIVIAAVLLYLEGRIAEIYFRFSAKKMWRPRQHGLLAVK